MLAIFMFLIGLVVGSFINVLSTRVPLGMSIVLPQSHCDSCEHPIRLQDNIPVISYLILKGRCRDCSAKIGIIYPLTELITGIIFLAIFLKFGFTFVALKYLLFSIFLITISATDLKTAIDSRFTTGMIPDIFLALLILFGVVVSLIETLSSKNTLPDQLPLLMPFASFALAFIVLYLPAAIYRAVRKKDGLGDGDILLFAGISLVVVGYAPIMLIVSCIFGIMAWIALMSILKRRDFMLPFAPFLSLGVLTVILFIL